MAYLRRQLVVSALVANAVPPAPGVPVLLQVLGGGARPIARSAT